VHANVFCLKMVETASDRLLEKDIVRKMMLHATVQVLVLHLALFRVAKELVQHHSGCVDRQD
jgi:hypothetical protein